MVTPAGFAYNSLAVVALAAFAFGIVCYHSTLKLYEDPMLSVDLGLLGTHAPGDAISHSMLALQAQPANARRLQMLRTLLVEAVLEHQPTLTLCFHAIADSSLYLATAHVEIGMERSYPIGPAKNLMRFQQDEHANRHVQA